MNFPHRVRLGLAGLFAVCSLRPPFARAQAEAVLTELGSAQTPEENQAVEKKLNSLGPSERPKLKKYFQDGSNPARKRTQALRAALKHYSPQEAIDLVNDEFGRSENDVDFRVDLAMEMSRWKAPASKALLRKALGNKKENGFVQVAASWSLATQGDNSGKQRAIDSIAKAEPWRDFGMGALVAMKARDAIPQLKKAMVGAKRKARDACRLAILRIELEDASPEKQLELLSGGLAEQEFFGVRQWSSFRLAEIGTPAAGKLLRRIAKDPTASGNEEAGRALLIGVERNKWSMDDIRSWSE